MQNAFDIFETKTKTKQLGLSVCIFRSQKHSNSETKKKNYKSDLSKMHSARAAGLLS